MPNFRQRWKSSWNHINWKFVRVSWEEEGILELLRYFIFLLTPRNHFRSFYFSFARSSRAHKKKTVFQRAARFGYFDLTSFLWMTSRSNAMISLIASEEIQTRFLKIKKKRKRKKSALSFVSSFARILARGTFFRSMIWERRKKQGFYVSTHVYVHVDWRAW